MTRKYPIIQIEEVQEQFCGCRRKSMVPLSDALPELAEEWCYEKNAGWEPQDFSKASGVKCWWICPQCKRSYKAQICNRSSKRSGCPYCTSKLVCCDNSLADLNPEIASEWHPRKNKNLTAADVTHASATRVWWLCKSCGHSWQTAVSDRTTSESGCPACYEARMRYAHDHPAPRKKPKIVVNDTTEISRKWYEKPSNEDFISIVETNLSVARQWHPTKNGQWKAWDFARGSSAKVWWKCKKGPDHEWQAVIYSRTRKVKQGCPFCRGKRLSLTNCLETKYPTLAKEFHPRLNGKYTPKTTIAVKSKSFWWQCKRNKDHEWKTALGNRINHPDCPFCSKRIISKENNLATEFPNIAAQLHPTMNGSVKATDLSKYSSKRVWWLCKKGSDHVWQALVCRRTSSGSQCPFCTGKKVSQENSLAALHPEIAKQWDYKKNGTLKPAETAPKSNKLVWWICAKGHSWHQHVFARIKEKSNCYECKTGNSRRHK